MDFSLDCPNHNRKAMERICSSLRSRGKSKKSLGCSPSSKGSNSNLLLRRQSLNQCEISFSNRTKTLCSSLNLSQILSPILNPHLFLRLNLTLWCKTRCRPKRMSIQLLTTCLKCRLLAIKENESSARAASKVSVPMALTLLLMLMQWMSETEIYKLNFIWNLSLHNNHNYLFLLFVFISQSVTRVICRRSSRPLLVGEALHVLNSCTVRNIELLFDQLNCSPVSVPPTLDLKTSWSSLV